MGFARTMTAICGTTLVAAGPAMAQVQDRGATDRQAWSEQAAQSLLNQLEGTWRVQVKIDSELVSTMREGAMQRDRGAQQNEQTREQQLREQQQREQQREREDAERQERQERQEGQQDRQTGQTTAGDNMVACNGFAMNSMILDGSILQEHTILELPTAAGGEGQDRQDRVAGTSGEAMEAMSFFAFDPASSEYSVVFMSNKMPGIHYDIGRYEAGSRRIVFNTMTRDHADRNPYDQARQNLEGENRDREDRDRRNQDETQRDRSTDRQDLMRRPGGDMHAGGGSKQVVLELLGEDSYRVTMYETTSARLRNLATPRTDPTQPNRDQTDRDQTDRDRTDRDRTDRDQTDREQTDRTDNERANQPNRMIDQPNGRIIYQATYQRLSSAQGAEAERMFEQLKQRISR